MVNGRHGITFTVRLRTVTVSPRYPPFGRLIRNVIMTFEPYLHWSFHDEHVLLSLIVLNSPLNFLLACLLVVSICLLERLNILIHLFLYFSFLLKFLFTHTQRFLTFSLDKNWAIKAFKLKSSYLYLALWRTGLYSIVMFLRL